LFVLLFVGHERPAKNCGEVSFSDSGANYRKHTVRRVLDFIKAVLRSQYRMPECALPNLPGMQQPDI